jgi:glycosyltransferase involved in cell wall biosynthesis
MKAGPRPLVSIGMAVYNGERYLRQALDSVKSQDYTNYELIISDNASTDHTEDICREYAAADNRVAYSRNATNIGAPANFNRVFALSHGRYFMWASDDDYRDPSYIRKCVNAFGTADNIVLAGTECYCLDADGRLLLLDKSLTTIGMSPVRRFMRYKRILHDYNTHRGGIFYGLYDRNIMRTVMPMKNAMTADQDMMLELSLIGSFVTVNEPLLSRRMTGSSRSFKSLAKSYGITNPLLIDGAYAVREYEIDRMIARASNINPAQKAWLMVWSLTHTVIVVGARVLELGYRRLCK